MEPSPYYLSRIREEFARRCESTSRYSLRAFAQALGMDPGAVSRILAGKRVPSPKVVQKMLAALELSPEEQQKLLRSLADVHNARSLKRMSPFFKRIPQRTQPAELSLDLFRVIADWYHYAILELTYTEGFRPEPQWISQQLGVPVTEVNLAVQRLRDLGLLETGENGWVKTRERLMTADPHLTTPALRRHQRQVLEKAIYSLENDPIQERCMSSMTVAINPEKIGLARKMIGDFMVELLEAVSAGKQKRVYHLNVGLYPVQKRGEE